VRAENDSRREQRPQTTACRQPPPANPPPFPPLHKSPYISGMQAFAALLERLVLTPSRNAKLALICDYLRHTSDPSRGWALAAITGDLDIPSVKPAAIRDLVASRVDPVLFGLSYDYVGDLAET